MKVSNTRAPATTTPSTPTTSERCQVLSRAKLLYQDGADASRDRPAHVRAGSGCAFIDVPGQGARLAVVQDDANFIALVDVKAGGKVTSIELPAGPGGVRQFDKARGNKQDKLDLESMAAAVIDGQPGLICMGSGSTSKREVFVIVTFGADGGPVVEQLPAAAFFKGLQAHHDFAGDELNVEGFVVDTGADGQARARFWNRGNGSGDAVDAVGEVPFAALLKHLRDPLAHAPPTITRVKGFALGALPDQRGNDIRLTFTDATRHPDGRTLFLAAAENSPNTYDDGEVAGTAIGVLRDDGTTVIVPLIDERGRPLTDKVEGITIDPKDPRRAYIVVDKDDPNAPAEMLIVQLAASLSHR